MTCLARSKRCFIALGDSCGTYEDAEVAEDATSDAESEDEEGEIMVGSVTVSHALVFQNYHHAWDVYSKPARACGFWAPF
jgi:hypothetical protein